MSNFLEQKSEPLDFGSVNAIVREGQLGAEQIET